MEKLLIGDYEKDNEGFVYYYEYNNSSLNWNLIDSYTDGNQSVKIGFDVKLISIGNNHKQVIWGEPNYSNTTLHIGRYKTTKNIPFSLQQGSIAEVVGNHDGLECRYHLVMPFL